MNGLLPEAPALCVTERTRFGSDSSLGFCEWLDLVHAARSVLPETGAEVRFDGVEVIVPPTVTENDFGSFCQFVAHEVGSRGMKIGAIHPCLSQSCPIGPAEENSEFFRRGCVAALVGRRLNEWNIRIGNTICLNTATSTAAWTAGNMTFASETMKICVRNVAEFAAERCEQCALEMRCDLAASCSPITVRHFLDLVHRSNVGILANTAHLMNCALGPNFPKQPFVSDDWKGDRAELTRGYRVLCAEIGRLVSAVHVSQTTLKQTKDPDGVIRGDQTYATDPDGVLDLVAHSDTLLSSIPGGLERTGGLTWDCSNIPFERLRDPATWSSSLEVLEKIRAERMKCPAFV